jgi:general secretion pathway protein C
MEDLHMIKLSNSSFLPIFAKLLLLLVLAKAMTLVLLWFLPSDGVELAAQNSYKPKYQRVDFENMIQSPASEKGKGSQSSGSNAVSITSMVLKGLYGKGNYGYVIVALKSSATKTSIIAVGEEFSGFTLNSIASMSATFTKAGKEFTLELEQTAIGAQMSRAQAEVEIDDGSPKSVSKEDILAYAKSPQEIWKEISIVEVKNGEEIEGFRVTKIVKNSKMASLGLREGDVIIKANNIELKSYKDAIDIYNGLDKLDAVQIVVLRENQEVELVYEIH